MATPRRLGGLAVNIQCDRMWQSWLSKCNPNKSKVCNLGDLRRFSPFHLLCLAVVSGFRCTENGIDEIALALLWGVRCFENWCQAISVHVLWFGCACVTVCGRVCLNWKHVKSFPLFPVANGLLACWNFHGVSLYSNSGSLTRRLLPAATLLVATNELLMRGLDTETRHLHQLQGLWPNASPESTIARRAALPILS